MSPRRKVPLPRAPNNSAEKKRLLLLPKDLDLDILRSAHAANPRVNINEWIREACRMRLKAEGEK